jgi:hypothetical protein
MGADLDTLLADVRDAARRCWSPADEDDHCDAVVDLDDALARLIRSCAYHPDPHTYAQRDRADVRLSERGL